jgi:adenosylcobinamide-GDP ribazoletransferase
MAALLLAVAFLTIIPVPLRGERAPSLGDAAAWFPAVGAAIGALAGLVAYATAPQLGSTVAAVLAVGLLVIVTGALHQDGLADSADGLGVHGDRVRRLEVMRDSTIGTFGALALGLWLLLMVSALAGLGRTDALEALVTAAALGRWAAIVHGVATPAARPEGLGAGFAPGPLSLAFATLTAVIVALACRGIVDGAVCVVVAAVVAALVTLWARSAVGGRTGDTLGATVALTEAAIVVTVLALV